MFTTGSPTTIDDDSVLRINGAQPFSAATVKEIETFCDKAEDRGGPGVMPVHVSGAPDGSWTRGLNVALVTKWERVLRRLERLPMTTVAVASGDCGGAALDALLATDLRIAGPGMRLLVPVDGGATWPGMALFRLSHQAGAARVRRAVLFGSPSTRARRWPCASSTSSQKTSSARWRPRPSGSAPSRGRNWRSGVS